MMKALTSDNVRSEVSDEALSLTVSAPSNRLLRTFYNCATVRDTWGTSQLS